jgi:hypothetical protein
VLAGSRVPRQGSSARATAGAQLNVVHTRAQSAAAPGGGHPARGAHAQGVGDGEVGGRGEAQAPDGGAVVRARGLLRALELAQVDLHLRAGTLRQIRRGLAPAGRAMGLHGPVQPHVDVSEYSQLMDRCWVFFTGAMNGAAAPCADRVRRRPSPGPCGSQAHEPGGGGHRVRAGRASTRVVKGACCQGTSRGSARLGLPLAAKGRDAEEAAAAQRRACAAPGMSRARVQAPKPAARAPARPGRTRLQIKARACMP